MKVLAAGINPSDVKNVAGTMHGTTLPRTPGRDFAGMVVQGPAEWMGREVFGTGGDLGLRRDGTHAELLVLPVGALVQKPAALAMDAAGSAGVTFITAWAAMVQTAAIAAGETAIVLGATGGVGSAAVQIAKARGARVIGVVRSPEDFAAARANGAEDMVSSGDGQFVQEILARTPGNSGGQVVFDTTGMLFGQVMEIAAPGGRIPVITAPRDGQVTFNLRQVYRKVLTIRGVDSAQKDAVACANVFREMAGLFESELLRPAGGEARKLGDIAAAYELSTKGGKRVLLHPQE